MRYSSAFTSARTTRRNNFPRLGSPQSVSHLPGPRNLVAATLAQDNFQICDVDGVGHDYNGVHTLSPTLHNARVGHPRHLEKGVLDFGGIDVDPARNDEVGIAPGHVKVAEVAESDRPIRPDTLPTASFP